MNKKMNTAEVENQMVQLMVGSLDAIYANKSSDEYKSHGDITSSSEYHTIEKMIADLKTIKSYPSNEADNMKTLFQTLHRPVFKTMVTEYIAEPNDKNIIFTAVYTVGFRVLVGELSRVYASTEATDKGIVYKPDKISRKSDMNKFIVTFNASLEKRINDYIRTSEHIQEGFTDTITDIASKVYPKIKNGIKRVFSTIHDFNPISMINSIIMVRYDKQVDTLEHISNLYTATYDAYKEYMRIPESQRKEKVESKYLKNIEKYKIQMDDLKSKIDHYDQRGKEDAKDALDEISTKTSTNTTKSDTSSSDDEFDF